MLSLLTIIFIHSTPLEQLAQADTPPTQKDQTLSLEGGKTVNVSAFEFTGNQAISTAELEKITKPYLNTSVSQSNLHAIMQKIEILYKSKGYTQVKVTVPAKQKSGTLTIVIKEGRKT